MSLTSQLKRFLKVYNEHDPQEGFGAIFWSAALLVTWVLLGAAAAWYIQFGGMPDR